MNLPARVLGQATARELSTRGAAPILRIGRDSFNRRDLAGVDCFNFTAAQNLSKLLNEHLKVADTKYVFDKVPPSALALPRLGAVTLAVLGAAFEAKHLGGDEPLLNYIKRHTDGDDVEKTMVTFSTLKHRELAEQRGEQKAKRARKAARRDKAHRTRVDRFTTRQSSTAESRSSA